MNSLDIDLLNTEVIHRNDLDADQQTSIVVRGNLLNQATAPLLHSGDGIGSRRSYSMPRGAIAGSG